MRPGLIVSDVIRKGNRPGGVVWSAKHVPNGSFPEFVVVFENYLHDAGPKETDRVRERRRAQEHWKEGFLGLDGTCVARRAMNYGGVVEWARRESKVDRRVY